MTIFSELYNKVLSFFNSEAKDDSSKDTACNRLKLVLMQDRAKMEPALMEKMRQEMVEVISKYVVIDKDALDLNLEAEGDSFALMLNIPVVRAKTREEIEELENDEDDDETEEFLEDEEDNDVEENEINETDEDSDDETDEDEEDDDTETEDSDENVDTSSKDGSDDIKDDSDKEEIPSEDISKDKELPKENEIKGDGKPTNKTKYMSTDKTSYKKKSKFQKEDDK